MRSHRSAPGGPPEQRGVPYMLLSPTGKAAKRLSEATGRDAYTIHRQLFSLDRTRTSSTAAAVPRRARCSCPADAVIVDEASMVDLPLLAWLLRSLGPRTRLIFVGDKEAQLASVGPGSVLRDLIACERRIVRVVRVDRLERIPLTLLTVIKRQGEGSPIVEAAHVINTGRPVARSSAAGDLWRRRAGARPPAEDGGVHAQQLIVEAPCASAPRSSRRNTPRRSAWPR